MLSGNIKSSPSYFKTKCANVYESCAISTASVQLLHKKAFLIKYGHWYSETHFWAIKYNRVVFVTPTG